MMPVMRDSEPDGRLMRIAGLLVAAGAVVMAIKGVLLVVTGNDRSLVPWFGLLTSLGFVLAAVALWRSVQRLRWLSALGGVAALTGVAAAAVAVGYLITGTIPESEGAPSAVGASYAILAAGAFLSLLSLGIVIAANRSLSGWWRWLPLGLVAVQMPIFIVAGAIGDGVGSEDVTDGMSLALTGAAWMLLGYALARPSPDSESRT
jgi:hypothetical protein